ncbi:hypothetical protein OH77DRAFT_1091711 [Trametes cingulata]|nr:hypothetical protein OH77DRAFT_1091711 [Trametes cingulata]
MHVEVANTKSPNSSASIARYKEGSANHGTLSPCEVIGCLKHHRAPGQTPRSPSSLRAVAPSVNLRHQRIGRGITTRRLDTLFVPRLAVPSVLVSIPTEVEPVCFARKSPSADFLSSACRTQQYVDGS